MTWNLNADAYELVTNRSLQLNTYAYRNNAWEAMDLGQVLQMINQRYNLETLARELENEFPGIIADDLRFVTFMFYIGWKFPTIANISL
ncbi:MAG: hypothetical protein HC888_09095 [Candidatus Competibacteraceae bacterium]|nr:hypothetical protein [Candidatus Competibacteraceae bacterium]